MLLVLERIHKVANNVNKMTDLRINHWKRLIHRLDKLFDFTSKADSDPETFARLVFDSAGKLDLFFLEETKLFF